MQAVQEEECEYKYTCELNKEWTPFNSNLHMQGIKVRAQDFQKNLYQLSAGGGQQSCSWKSSKSWLLWKHNDAAGNDEREEVARE